MVEIVEFLRRRRHLHHVPKLVRNLCRRQHGAVDQLFRLKRLESIHHWIIDRARITRVETLAENNSRRDEFALIIPLVFARSRPMRITSSNSDGNNEMRVARIQLPLRAADLGREKLVLPFLIPLLIFIIDHFANTAALGIRKDRMFTAYVSVGVAFPQTRPT